MMKHPKRQSAPEGATDGQTSAQIIAPHERSYPDPLATNAGDQLSLSGRADQWDGEPAWTFLWCVDQQGKGGWVPRDLITQQGATGIARQDYDCRELSVRLGELVTLGATVSGWAWCTNLHGQSGWVPVKCLRLTEQDG